MSNITASTSKSASNGDRKKLSWIYRRKKKAQKVTTTHDDRTSSDGSQNKNARIIVRNLSFKATEENIKEFYGQFGKIQEINLLKHPDGKPVGCGFIQFERVQDASRAIFNTNKGEFLGRVISSSWAVPKSKFCEKLDAESLEEKAKEKVTGGESMLPEIVNQDKIPNTEPVLKVQSVEKQKLRKIQKERNRKKRARIIVRNLPFEVTPEDLKEHFARYGTIEDVRILKKEDGKNVGCAFIQFQLVQNAAKAIHHANLKSLNGRPIVVDWAVPKNKFCKQEEDRDRDDIVKVKEEKESESESENKEVGVKSDGDEKAVEVKVETDSEESEENDEDESDGNIDSKEIEEKNSQFGDKARDSRLPRRESHDIAEGKTVFLKNVPFSVNNEQLKTHMQRFGPVYYALVCIDPLTEHSKGTAFVKFKFIEDAEKCLAAGSQLQIGDQILEAHKALERGDIENKANRKHETKKDSRNLYLVKEGVVLAGSPAAGNVSAADMAKRLRLEQWKSQILRNLNMFVSRVRLVVQNLPPSVDDVKLRKIFERHSGPNAIIREARVMRDFKNLDANGVGKSKEYGFVSFTTHEDALQALRNVNNNPTIFSVNQRPIVAFSIENRIMVNAKYKRIEKSREHNPLYQGNKMKRKSDDAGETVPAKKSRTDKKTSADVNSFTGTIGKPGENKLRSKYSLKNQAAAQKEVAKKQKKQKKSVKKIETKKKEATRKRREVKVKPGEKRDADDAHFSNLVNKYKNKLQSIELKKSKWYEN